MNTFLERYCWWFDWWLLGEGLVYVLILVCVPALGGSGVCALEGAFILGAFVAFPVLIKEIVGWLVAEVWTQVNRKKGKGQVNKAADQTRSAPSISLEVNPGEESLPLSVRAPTPAPGPSMPLSTTANADLTRTASVLPLDVNTGGAPQPSAHDPSNAHDLLRHAQNCPQSSNAGLSRSATDLPLHTYSGGPKF
ncbi:hypothetical protein NL676_029889 [Syzygium grande]|nr:hypothetical protein NL676_029889 [Syzygium grande]